MTPAPRRLRFRRVLHRFIDAPRSLPNHWRARRVLASLPSGDYHVAPEIPYVAQFATPALISAYIHDNLHGCDDPNWRDFGAPNADDYTFWAHRACAIACIKMAMDTFKTASTCSVWELIQEGLALGGYRAHDDSGALIDEGWFYPALKALATRHGLEVRGADYVSPLNLCIAIREGWIVAAAVSPDLGERDAIRRYDGHFVLVYGFTWQNGLLQSLTLHNPSGRYPELQAGAIIPARRFRRAFAYRYIAFRPA